MGGVYFQKSEGKGGRHGDESCAGGRSLSKDMFTVPFSSLRARGCACRVVVGVKRCAGKEGAHWMLLQTAISSSGGRAHTKKTSHLLCMQCRVQKVRVRVWGLVVPSTGPCIDSFLALGASRMHEGDCQR
jgi:hypothetical protein